MSEAASPAGLRAGKYRHWKDKLYTVFGVAYAHAGEEFSGRSPAIRSGTEDTTREFIVILRLTSGGIAYEGADLGPLVLYKPDYGSQALTFRPLTEFTEEVPGHGPRFAFAG